MPTGRYIKLFSSSMPMCDVTKLDYYPKLLEVSNLPPANTCPMVKVRVELNGMSTILIFNFYRSNAYLDFL